MLQSLLVYSIVLLLMLIFSYKAASKGSFVVGSTGIITERKFVQIEIIILILIFSATLGLRFDVGVDYIGYLYAYVNNVTLSKGEFLFESLGNILRYFNAHYTLFFGTIAFLQITFFFLAFKKERFLYPFLVFFLFTNGDFLEWSNIMRQTIAACIWLYSIRYIEENKIWKYCFWVLVAFFFHRSAIVLLIFYPILRNGWDYFKSVPLQLILIAVAFISKSLFYDLMLRLNDVIELYIAVIGGIDLYQSYTTERLLKSFRESEGTGLVYMFKILLNVFIVINSKNLKTFYDSKRFTLIYFFFFIGIITFYIIPVGFIAIRRPFSYFYLFQMVMYAYFAYYLLKTKTLKNHLILYTIIIVFLGVFYLSQITARPDSHHWYQFYFQNKNFII